MTEQIDYDPNTVLEALNNKADRDLNNVTDGTYQVLTTKNITNCLTKIPQDIKLELSEDGTLTLKAGSKVYVPNGVGVFDEIIINSDRSISDKSFSSGALVIFSSISGASIRAVYTSFCTSGTSAPTDVNYRAWYDITNNVVKSYSEGSYIDNMSLPIAVCTYINNEGFISIDQVFNGFGYIGSTIFALPGVEGLIPNGRNADGSLNNAKFKTTDVKILQNTVIRNNRNIALGLSGWFLFTSKYDYNDNTNYNYDNNGISLGTICITISADSTGRITSLNPKTTFQAIDRNEIDNIIDTRINYRFQVVSELPPVQDPNTFYFIPEE